jgi:serine phosphatase RsbU (regulator of sigma subunit)
MTSFSVPSPAIGGRQQTAASLRQEVPWISSTHTNDDVLALFTQQQALIALPVVEADIPIGLINRNQFMDAMARPFHREIYGRKGCTAFMDRAPLIVEQSVSIPELSFLVVDAGGKTLADGFILTQDGCYRGMGNSRDLVRAIADLQVEKNRLVTESINYASVIQKSFLRPSRAAMARELRDYCVHWEPRDIVGGDYYFFADFDDGFFFAVIDCTGHGVPGAFLTLIVSSFFNRALLHDNRRDPAAVLADVNRMIKHALSQSEAVPSSQSPQSEPQSDDGMDAVFAWVDTREGAMTYASARTPVFKLGHDDAEVTELPGDRVGAGYIGTPVDYRWSNRVIALSQGDAVYVSTDGIIDQIGGERQIAYGKKRLKESLLAHRDRPLLEQLDALLADFHRYQGYETRRDDVSMFGFRI